MYSYTHPLKGQGGRPVRVLYFDEYQHHVLMGVSGYALVEKFLQQY